jgi:hypothetical protein
LSETFSIFSEDYRLNLLPGKMMYIENWKKQSRKRMPSDLPDHCSSCSARFSWWLFCLIFEEKTVQDKEGFILA